MENSTVKNYLLVIVMLCFFAPLIVKFLPFNSPELKGVTEPVTAPSLTLDTWLSGDYQPKHEGYFSFNLGLRKAAVRTGSQLNYWLGQQMNAAIVGKENELMGKEYIESYHGKDFIGTDSLNRLVNNIVAFSEALKNNGKELVIVLAPSKCRLYPERIPDEYRTVYNSKTNYTEFVKALEMRQLNVLNFQDWFGAINNKAPYPLFSNLGVHWSTYAATMCADSMMGYIGRLTNKKVNRIKFNKLLSSNEAFGTDKDLQDVMNLWYPVPLRRALGYFDITLTPDTSNYTPGVLVVGDSYYWNIIYTTVPEKFFAPGSVYYYYNSTAYFNNGTNTPVKQLNILEQLKNKDVVILIYAEPNLRNLGNGIDKDYLTAINTVSK